MIVVGWLGRFLMGLAIGGCIIVVEQGVMYQFLPISGVGQWVALIIGDIGLNIIIASYFASKSQVGIN